VSESFTNDAAGFTGTFYQVPFQCSCTAGSVGLQIYFDAASQGYTVTSDGVSQTFLPGDRDPSRSSTAISVYLKSDGVHLDTLSLTNPGTSGALTYQYVGAGFWQRQTSVSDPLIPANNHFDLDNRAFTYGVETPDSALPRTGSGGYAVDLVGALNGEVPSILSGDGTLSVNFGSGAVATSGTLTEYSIDAAPLVLSTGTFSGQAQLSSSTNAFGGTFGLTATNTFSGGLNGRFYGPLAEEVGAVWSVTNPDGSAGTGTITGRVDDSINVTLASSKTPVSDGSDALAISYDAASQSYTLTAAGRTVSLDAADRDLAGSSATFDLFRKTLADGSTLDARIYNAAGSPLALSYTSFAELVFRGPDGVAATGYQLLGQRTAASQMPRTGSASYTGAIYGRGAVNGAASSAFYALGGTSRLNVDFGSNRASGSLAITGTNADGTRDFGSFGFQSTAMSGGQFSATAGGANATGSVNGAFFGPNAQEFGAGFAINQGYANGDAATFTGVTIGKKAP
jgi:hypothetical protein